MKYNPFLIAQYILRVYFYSPLTYHTLSMQTIAIIWDFFYTLKKILFKFKQNSSINISTSIYILLNNILFPRSNLYWTLFDKLKKKTLFHCGILIIGKIQNSNSLNSRTSGLNLPIGKLYYAFVIITFHVWRKETSINQLKNHLP